MTFLSSNKVNRLYLVYVLNSPYGINIKRQLETVDIIIIIIHVSTDRITSIGILASPYEWKNRIAYAVNFLFEVIYLEDSFFYEF